MILRGFHARATLTSSRCAILSSTIPIYLGRQGYPSPSLVGLSSPSLVLYFRFVPLSSVSSFSLPPLPSPTSGRRHHSELAYVAQGVAHAGRRLHLEILRAPYLSRYLSLDFRSGRITRPLPLFPSSLVSLNLFHLLLHGNNILWKFAGHILFSTTLNAFAFVRFSLEYIFFGDSWRSWETRLRTPYEASRTTAGD